MRETFDRLEEELIWIAGRANQLVDWSRSHQFCGRCGHQTEDRTQERAKICPTCGLINYPRLSPAVIVAVVRGDRLLLASNKRFKSGFYSVLAGFVEPGETLEDCVAREIRETATYSSSLSSSSLMRGPEQITYGWALSKRSLRAPPPAAP